MHNCPQTKGQSTLDHGFSVKNHVFDLLNHLKHNTPLKYEFRIPEWVYSNKDLILNSLPCDRDLKLYTVFHDCGKWECLTVDDKGKSHFPNHSEVSYQVSKKIFNNDLVSDLIRHDMDIHVLKSDQLGEFSKNDNCITLLIVGLCEINSNAKMFGGLESDSFKIKYKSILKKGKKIIEFYEKNRIIGN